MLTFFNHRLLVNLNPLALATLRTLGVCTISLLLTPWATAQIVADPNASHDHQATIINTANGLPQVNIQTPSASGVSHNIYTQFDVGPEGVILNNSREAVQTQQAGWVAGNPWLANGAARIILNEVNSSNPSLLHGYIEVAGSRAEVIVANPSGITCDGCGFINASRSTLTTGTPQFLNGHLDGYLVERGVVRIEGGGLDTTHSDYTDIIARAVDINNGIWANDLKITTGSNRVNADNTEATAIAAKESSKPAFAIDSAQLGGMYAGKITLTATEAGVGVRNAGEIGAGVGEFVLTADGHIENTGKITSQGNTKITAKSGIKNTGTIYAQKNTTLTTDANIDNTGVIAARGDTRLVANHIQNTSDSVLAAGMDGDGHLLSTGDLLLTVADQLQVNGQALSGGNQVWTSGSIDASNSQVSANNLSFATTLGDLNTIKAVLTATGNFTANVTGSLYHDEGALLASDIAITAADFYNRQGQVAQQGNGRFQLQLMGNFDNSAGQLFANGNSDISLDGDFTNTNGTLFTGKNLNLTANRFSGDGQILSQGDLSIQLFQDHTQTGELQAGGSIALNTLGKFTNLSHLIAGQDLQIKANAIDNTQSGEITAQNTALIVNNTLTNRGLIDGSRTFLQADTLNNLGSGRLYGDDLAIQARNLTNDIESGLSPVIAARHRLDLGVETLLNREHSLIFSAGDMAIGGNLDASKNATGQAKNLSNHSATIQALGNLDINAAQITNANNHFNTALVEVSREPIIEYQLSGHYNRYRPDQISLGFGEVWFLYAPDGWGDDFNRYGYTRTIRETQVIETDPGKILAGGGLHLIAENVLNDNSQILAGGDLVGNIGTLTNTEILGQRITTDSGNVIHYYRIKEDGTDRPGMDFANYNPPARVQTMLLTTGVIQANTAPQNSDISVDPLRDIPTITTPDGSSIRTGNISPHIPDNVLYTTNPAATAGFYVATDPRFANYRAWLGSDYMLQQLGADANVMQKRLGDGFYEQQLVREQIAQLTGRAFLDGYSDNEAEYRSLMDNGIAQAQTLELRPGIALTADQMSALTSDIVWLVEKDVTLPDGTQTRALVPQVYARVQPGDVTGDGALISGNNLALRLNTLVNSGTLAVKEQLAIRADNLNNLGGRISGNDVMLIANHDLNNLGGTLDAKNSLTAVAGNDLNIASTTHSEQNAQGRRTNLAQVAAIHVSGENANLTLAAGHDVNINAAQITNSGENSQTLVSANHDLNLGTVRESSQEHITWDADNHRSESASTDIGSQVTTQGDLHLQAGHDLNAIAASVETQSALTALANHDLTIRAGQSRQSADESHQVEGGNGMLSHTTTTTHDTEQQTLALGSHFGGNTTLLQAGNNLTVTGSAVISDQATRLTAGNNLTLNAATNTYAQTHDVQETTSGAFGGVSQGGFTIGTQSVETKNNTRGTQTVGATIGSLLGDIQLQAGKDYTQIGSQVLAPIGNIDITGQNLNIQNAQNTQTSTQETHFTQTGLSVTVTNPIISTVQTGQQMNQDAGQTSNFRLQALAAGTAALSGKNAFDAVKSDPRAAGGINISASLGTTKSDSVSTQTSNTAQSSTIAAGNNIHLTATGKDKASDLTIQGSTVNAGHDATLKADGDLNLLAAQNTLTQTNTNSSTSGSIGVGVGVGSQNIGVSVNAAYSQSNGDAKGGDITHTNTQVNANNRLTLISGGDATLSGATASANQVIADIGGNLNLQSLQDTSTYNSSQTSASAGLSVPVYGGGYGSISGSANLNNTTMDSNYASVIAQSGIAAGDQGFQLHVNGNTNLSGAVITSTDQAVKDHKNTLTTGTLTTNDITNTASYNASSTSIGGGYTYTGSSQPASNQDTSHNQGDTSQSAPNQGVGHDQSGQAQAGTKQVPNTTLPSIKGISATPPTSMNASDSASSTTQSGISQAIITITDEKAQKATGKDAASTIASLNRNVETGQNTTNALTPIFNQTEIQAGFDITSSFTRETGTFLANRAQESTAAKAALKEELEKPKDQQDQAKIAQLNQTIDANKTWDMGGTGRQILTAINAAASGNVMSTGTQFVQAAAVNYLQSLGAETVKVIANDLNSETARAALQGLLACGGAATQGANCGAAAQGAAASVVLNNLANTLTDTNAKNLTPEERQARENLITSMITGITATAGGDVAIANAAAQIEMENNSLATAISGAAIGAETTWESGPGVLGGIIAGGIIGGLLFDSEGDSGAVTDETSQGTPAGKTDEIDANARTHILDGDKNGGGHRSGTGIPGKSEFPPDWSDDKIMDEISDVATSPSSSRKLGPHDRTIVEGTRGGIDIRVIVDANGRIITGFPTNVPRNPIP